MLDKKINSLDAGKQYDIKHVLNYRKNTHVQCRIGNARLSTSRATHTLCLIIYVHYFSIDATIVVGMVNVEIYIYIHICLLTKILKLSMMTRVKVIVVLKILLFSKFFPT